MGEEKPEKQCLVCGRGQDEIPLLKLSYRQRKLWICPQHLPVLIHDPGQLAELLPGAERFKPADSSD